MEADAALDLLMRSRPPASRHASQPARKEFQPTAGRAQLPTRCTSGWVSGRLLVSTASHENPGAYQLPSFGTADHVTAVEGLIARSAATGVHFPHPSRSGGGGMGITTQVLLAMVIIGSSSSPSAGNPSWSWLGTATAEKIPTNRCLSGD
jgi:hypothetical protein